MSSQHHQQSRPHSPDLLPPHLKSPVLSDPYNVQGASNSNHQNLYSSFQMPSDLTPTPTDHDELNQHGKVNGFSNGPYHASAGFSAFSNNRGRNPSLVPGTTNAFRDTTLTQPYPTAADIFVPHMSPTQTSLPPGFDSLQQSRAIDYRGSHLTSPFSGVNPKAQFNNVDPFGASSTLLQSHQVGKAGVIANTQVSQQQPHSHHHPMYQATSQMGYANGLTMHSQTPFGPHLPSNGMTATAAPIAPGPGMNHANGGSASGTSQEEISTIFVVGFPDDMSEREFQNMFTFCNGFEAATLKIPNKESTAYGSGNPLSRSGNLQYQTAYAGQNDPYNVVTVNQGGVVVDGGRDGTTSSWPATIPDDSHFVHNAPAQPPRKQIIGFAKFRTRDEALAARDQLQGRRVDIEKGAVLKAEMAKKNLHTKRGVGPLGGTSSGTSANERGGGGGSLAADGLGFGDQLTSRERETFAAMGLRRESRIHAGDRDDEERHRTREREMSLSMGLGSLGSRGPRERAEDDERERERRRKETRLRSSNANAFDAFHSVPSGRLAAGSDVNGFSLHTQPSMPDLSGYEGFVGASANPWGSASVFRKPSVPILTSGTIRPPSVGPQSSPPGMDAFYPLSAGPLSASSVVSDKELLSNLPNSAPPLSPSMNPTTLPSHPSLPTRPRPYSPSTESQGQAFGLVGQVQTSSSVPPSSASSVSGSQVSEGELSRSMAGLPMTGSQGSTSPQLPSPASGASSGTRGNPGDQNPPINTLYVGNLPTSPMPTGYPPNFLEDTLRELFARRPGYRKLCFRQKSNGPMCFVEFDDVHYATKALNELYGHSLGGLIKGGGIRLSYSKNPLGVRTPTSANGNHQYQHQQAGAAGQYPAQVPSAFAEPFQPRQPQPTYIDSDLDRTIRRDTSGMASPTYHYTAPSPPRFFSPSPSSQFNPQVTASTYPRGNSQGYTSSTFSPFAMTPSPHPIPDQSSPETGNEHFTHALPSNLEAARVG